MIPATTPLIGFSGEIIWPIGQILLPVKIRDAEHFTSTWMNFLVVRSPSPYNGIIGRPEVRKIQAVTPEARPFDIIHAAEERIKVFIHPEHPEQTIIIGSTLTEEGRKALCDLLRRSLDVFAWKPADMTGNVGATYQHLVDKALQKQLAVQKHLAETWKSIIVKGTFLGYKVNTEGIMTAEAEAAFKEMKKLIAEFLTLTALMEKEELIVYLAATQEAVSAVLMRKREAKQMPVYFVNRNLQGPKINYTSMEKLYRLRTSVKGQILADFIVERPEDDSLDTPMEAEEELLDPWTLFTNESSCIDGSGARLILTNPEGPEFTYALRFRFDATNNEAEYEALIDGLRIAEQIGVKNLQANVDSRLVANQHACQNKICGSKGHTDRILLAENACGCKKIDKSMSRLPVSPPRAKKSAAKINSHHTIHSKIGVKSYAYAIALLPSSIHRPMAYNGDTPFSLTYGTEAVISAEISMPTMRTAKVDMVQNDEALEINLDLLEERREQAEIREAKIKAKMEKYYNSKVRNTSFKPGDLVYRSNEASHAKESGKLSPKWEGPYEVTEALGNGAYKLRDHNGKLLPRTWNVRSLKRCYIHEM
ncbi:reverse transcriptase domain-containing protein [Tanacetum coccineum]|uniref:Reverse transcriptase domain-containing protein n=1 Tax=Tanacetum coccineum TaxID=301880 RepID=A0ABQ4X6X4_9ASTR